LSKRIKYIPESVTHLTFGFRFSHFIEDALPSSITHLRFGYFFDQEILNNIPASVTHLRFGGFFKQDFRDIPDTIKELTIPKSYYDYTFKKHPPKFKLILTS